MTALPIVERPALAATLAALTDRPIGHWIAELRSPAWRGKLEFGPNGVKLLLFDDAFRNVVTPRWRFWSTVPASKAVLGRDADGTVRYAETPAHLLTPDEGTDALITRSVLPLDFADDPARAFACGECGGSGQVPAIVGGERVQCPLCAEDCPTCGGVGKVAGVVCETCGGETIVKDDRSPGAHGRPRDFETLVAWASLGTDTILQAETHARDAARAEVAWYRQIGRADLIAGRAPVPRITWRVISSREQLLGERRTRFGPLRSWRDPAARFIESTLPQSMLVEDRTGVLVTRRGLTREERTSTFYQNAIAPLPGHRILPDSMAAPTLALWAMGLALDRIDRYGVVIACPGFSP